MRKLRYILSAVGLCGWLLANGQEVRFSQFEASPTHLNPALSGTVESTTLNFQSRLQQFGAFTYKTGYLAATVPLYRNEEAVRPLGGLALGVMSDWAGEFNEIKTHQVDFSAAYNLWFNRQGTHFLTFGLQTAFLRTNIDYGSLTWPSQIRYNGFAPTGTPSDIYAAGTNLWRFNAGVLWTLDPTRQAVAKNYALHLGASASNLNQPDQSWIRDETTPLPLIYKLHGGGHWQLNRRYALQPRFFVVAQQPVIQYTAGTQLSIALQPPAIGSRDLTLLVGTWYRVSDAVIASVGMESQQYSAVLSYDANASPARAGIGNQQALELSVTYRFTRTPALKSYPTPLF